jgi:hypothetical protein
MINEPESHEYRYKTSIDQCDIVDREALAMYRDKRYEWLSWYELRKSDPNTIQQQIFSMLFLDLAYRTLVLARHETDEGSVFAAQNGLLAHFLDQGYVATQILAIRKMLDRRPDVFSLRRLLEDIANHRLLITREIYVCHDGLPFDSAAWQSLPQGIEGTLWGIQARGFSNYLASRARHEVFDRLAGVSPTDRKRCDRIRASVFQELRRLANDASKKLILLGNKFFAHAATPDSRGSLEYSGITLADIDEVQRALVRVERAITDLLLFLGVYRDVVPIPPLGLLKGLHHPYASAESIAKMDQHWDQLVAARNQWPKGIAEAL